MSILTRDKTTPTDYDPPNRVGRVRVNRGRHYVPRQPRELQRADLRLLGAMNGDPYYIDPAGNAWREMTGADGLRSTEFALVGCSFVTPGTTGRRDTHNQNTPGLVLEPVDLQAIGASIRLRCADNAGTSATRPRTPLRIVHGFDLGKVRDILAEYGAELVGGVLVASSPHLVSKPIYRDALDVFAPLLAAEAEGNPTTCQYRPPAQGRPCKQPATEAVYGPAYLCADHAAKVYEPQAPEDPALAWWLLRPRPTWTDEAADLLDLPHLPEDQKPPKRSRDGRRIV